MEGTRESSRNRSDANRRNLTPMKHKSALESAKIHGCLDRTRRRQVEAVFDVLRDSVLGD